MTCAEVTRDAVGLVASPRGDHARVAAEAHAATCPACARALERAQATLALLDAAPPLPPPSAAALRRASAPILRDLAGRTRALWAIALALLVSLGFALWAGQGGAMVLRPALGLLCVGSEVLTALLPLAVAAVLVRRGRAAGSAAFFAAVASAGGLLGHGHLHLHCPAQTSLPHLLVFHTGGILVCAGLGALVSRLPFLRPASA
ncbi:MAG: DUF1109 family protein [Deltaproteobacteria bacterium]|nr:DUF1109 family protein [Deltaproteobacteria bacterium]